MGSPDFRISKIRVNILTSCSWHKCSMKILLYILVPLPGKCEISFHSFTWSYLGPGACISFLWITVGFVQLIICLYENKAKKVPKYNPKISPSLSLFLNFPQNKRNIKKMICLMTPFISNFSIKFEKLFQIYLSL